MYLELGNRVASMGDLSPIGRYFFTNCVKIFGFATGAFLGNTIYVDRRIPTTISLTFEFLCSVVVGCSVVD